ncbi:ammonia permease [Scheffersomyces stipitis CBS 6054]|uniref:Ammonium transporter n=1 Tax=Scheffersomyces stipitis (strain ATCC 58785 / CBS 6054 / NBRC 10063 / NRRL Y-11545) TaxID=322104 RepID=A3LSR0_PICST|nr:ammonia permease [Scheffersomyces stipitis CBS 6054]ABN66276.1 ammonia permease [Scheffersomyces stipitis CBS 6054]
MSANFTGEDGGNVFTDDLNSQFDKADTVWIGIASVLVWIMIPGVGLLYSGISRKKHALSLMWAAIMAACLTAFQWFFWGYSLVFSKSGSSVFLGNLEFFGLKNVFAAPAVVSTVPDILFCLYQGMFAATTAILMVGAGCERARLGPMMVFLFIWLTVVYCPIAFWTWGGNGWLFNLGALDFAGGGPVHENSGFAALAYSLILGKRNDPLTKGKVPKYKPHSVSSIVLGTVFLWFGWFGFNGGSTGNATIRSWYACVNTNLAAASGGLTWMFVDWFRTGGKWSTVGLCLGAIAGLVGITPAAGFVPVYTSVVFGVVPAIVCNFAVDLKEVLQIDDGMDVFALHGIGGICGSILTGLFAADYVAAADGSVYGDPSLRIAGGWINHHWKQLGYQLAGSCSVGLWSFVVTAILLFVMDKIPFLRIRLHEDEEMLGTDLAQIGEFAYYEEEGKNPEESAYVLEPIRSTDARIAKLRATASAGAEAEEAAAAPIDGTVADGTGSVSPDNGTVSDGSKK